MTREPLPRVSGRSRSCSAAYRAGLPSSFVTVSAAALLAPWTMSRRTRDEAEFPAVVEPPSNHSANGNGRDQRLEGVGLARYWLVPAMPHQRADLV